MKKYLKLSVYILMIVSTLCVSTLLAQNALNKGAYELNKADVSDIFTSFSASVPNQELTVGDSVPITFSMDTYENYIKTKSETVDYKDITVNIGNEDVVGVCDGNLIAVGPGTTTVQFLHGSDPDDNNKSLIEVTVTGSSSDLLSILIVKPVSAEIHIGQKVTFTAYPGIFSWKTYEEIQTSDTPVEATWSSGDESILIVDRKGNVTGVGEGETYVMANLKTDENVAGSSEITVSKGEEQSIQMEEEVYMEVGDTYQLSPTIVTSGDEQAVGAMSNKLKLVEFKFYCTSHSVVDVDSTGLLTAKKPGEATVTCKAGDLSAECKVYVDYPEFTVNAPNEMDVTWGEKSYICATLSPIDAQKTYSSEDTSIATISKYGNVKGQKVGSTYVVTKAPDGATKRTKVNVVYPRYTIDVATRGITLFGGEKYNLDATLSPSKGKLQYKSSNKKVATVDPEGVVTANKQVNGEATITITAPDGVTKATVSVQVYRAEYDLTIQEEMFIGGGEKKRIEKTLTPDNGRCTWESNNTSIASVNMYGTVTAKKGVEGDCIITCTAPDGVTQKQCTVHVSKAPTIELR